MAYARVPDVSAGDMWTATQHNTYIRDNFEAGVPDIFTTKGDIAAATGANVAVRVAVGSDQQCLIALASATAGVTYRAGIGAAASHTAAMALAGAATDIIPWDTEIFDPDSCFTTGAAAKFTCPVAGLYLVCGNVSIANHVSGQYYQLRIFKNTALLAGMGYFQGSGALPSIPIGGSVLVNMAASDILDLRIYHTGNGDIDRYAAGAVYPNCSFMLVR